MFPTFASLLSSLALLQCAQASPTGATPDKSINKRAVTPVLSAASQVATASYPYWNRDSCTSVRVQYREFWTCRDSAGQGGQFYSSTASWSDFNNGPLITNGQLYLYGDDNGEYFKNQPDECQAGSNSGNCMNGTRYAIWPDSPPLPVAGSNNAVKLYTWIIKSYLNNDLSPITKNPATSLYRSDYNPANQGVSKTLPPVTLVNENFWPAQSIPYGSYGWAISPDGKTAYLYGQLNNGTANLGAALARVPINSIEDKSQYSYYNNGGWSSTAPSLTSTSARIANAGTNGQGTFYYSSYFSSYMWLGADSINIGSGFYVATAPIPEGPWTSPILFYNGTNGNASLGAYSQQAHPGLTSSNGGGNDIYLTFSKNDKDAANSSHITTTHPLIHVIWN
ncbi:hypothetical protein M409DRAFT_52967 [Zasmidium cellare ATCC 36951]|uniref:DUF4185 domain-containing protein n=1 Tax=Zasmidium cellare ATCC 36951 TaxID=1080233 RepID=A0A6A6CPK6_ZASCE|nr:uncharacterized protein M409DRAFT_52967 [Zasmidium cellare ATCC 36951]KAF2168991.1 hypothetical protein M409DRAFT_52967 [Zasmidium cellare ATCC 36951]